MNNLQSNILSAKVGDIFVSTKYGMGKLIDSSRGFNTMKFANASFTLMVDNFSLKNYVEGMIDFMGLVEVINNPSAISMFGAFLKLQAAKL